MYVQEVTIFNWKTVQGVKDILDVELGSNSIGFKVSILTEEMEMSSMYLIRIFSVPVNWSPIEQDWKFLKKLQDQYIFYTIQLHCQ